MYYEIPAKHKKLLKPEFDYIHGDADDKADEATKQEKVSWVRLLGFKQTWAFVMGKFLTDPIWWFYLFWLPDFLESQYGIKGTAMALARRNGVCSCYYWKCWGRMVANVSNQK